MIIYFDSIQEGMWFKELHQNLDNADLRPFPKVNSSPNALLNQVLSYDRPDIILLEDGKPILVIERTIEVPSGHNVGQRFARLAAAAQMRIPVVYFGPYAAYKHGGSTQGPRYMNLRLFYALEKMEEIEGSSITLINWPVDENYEIIQDPSKNVRMIDYLKLFFDLYEKEGLSNMIFDLKGSDFEHKQKIERQVFINSQVVNPEQYDLPPNSVKIADWRSLIELSSESPQNLDKNETVLYNIGMRYVRSDPYTGMAMLYAYLYCNGMKERSSD